MGSSLTTITAGELAQALSGDPEALDVHLELVERDVRIDGLLVKVHCHCLAVDGNGRVQPRRLAEFMRNAVADYAIPRSKLTKAKQRDQQYNSTEAVTALVEQARQSFTDLAKTGEGGEMLLFLLAERFLKLPHILCKMDLKTDKPMNLGPLEFVKKGDAAEHLRKMLYRYDVGDKVSAADAQILSAALARHPDANSKVGCGVSHFSVRSADFGSRCFWVNRTDGTTEKFSYKACIFEKRISSD